MAKYKIGDILLEDRRDYGRGVMNIYKERDANHPFCVLIVEDIRPNIEIDGIVYEDEECYWLKNITINTYTFGRTTILDRLPTVRLARQMEIYLYGGGREKLEKD